MSRRSLVLMLGVVVIALAWPAAGAFAGGEGYGFGSISPGSGPPGTEISYTVAGSANADSECRGSSAFSTEFLAADGVRLGTGADTIAVPETAAEGTAYVRLICYIADSTGRRVIHGFCAPFTVSAAGTAAAPSPEAAAGVVINTPCPPAPRTVMSQSVIRVQTNIGLAFNQVITPLGG